MTMDQRESLLEAGVEMVHERGFGATGVREIAAAAAVPQGSFTNHFRSKDAFGVLVLDRYSDHLDRIMRETLENAELGPQARLWAYFDRITESLTMAGWRRGCVVADMAAEIPPHSEAMRVQLCAILRDHAGRFEQAVRLVHPQDGDAAADLGSFLLAAWHGTLLRMKTERDPAAIERFRRVLGRLIGPRPEA